MYVNPYHKSKYLFIHLKKKFTPLSGMSLKKYLCKKTPSYKSLARCVNRNKFMSFQPGYDSKIFYPFEMLYYQIVKTKLHPLNQPLSHFYNFPF